MPTFICGLSWALTGLIIIFFFILAYSSNFLRDELDNPAAFMWNGRTIAKYRTKKFDEIPRPFSLARTQFAIWTVVIAAVYLHHLLCIPGCELTMANSTTTLTLLGISAGTTGLANTIDKSAIQQNATTPRHQ